MANKRDYIIFDKAPKIVFNYDEALYPFEDWYTNVNRGTDRPKIPGTITTSDCSSDFILNNVEVEYVRVRGNYTTNYRKKPLKIKFTEKQNLFGLNKTKKAKEWILLADYGDNAMLRNALAFYIGQKILRTQWSPTFTYVQVYANSEYLGLYLLCDQKEVGKNRVNVNEPEKDYTGVDIGYFFERDDYYTPEGEDPGFIIQRRNPSDYQPERLPIIPHETNKYYGQGAQNAYRDGYTLHSKIYSEDQENFIKKYMCLIYTIMYEAVINNTYYEINSTDVTNWENWELIPSNLNSAQEVISKVVDIDSFVDMYILNELAGNPDLAHSSFYFCLDASSEGNKKLALTCPWDWDRAFGLCDGLSNPTTTSLWAKDAHYNPWIALLPQADWFINLLKIRWQELYDNHFMRKSLNMIDDFALSYSKDFNQNYTKYSIRWENDPWDNTNPKKAASINVNYYSNVQTEYDCEVLLRTWYNQRLCSVHSLLDGKGSTDWPDDPQPGPHHKDMEIWEKANNERVLQFRGLSTDAKPYRADLPTLGNGSLLIEMDTGKMFMYDGENDIWYRV